MCIGPGQSGDTLNPDFSLMLADNAPGQVLVRLALEDTVPLARITRKSAHALNLQPGMAVVAQVRSVAVA